jgi:23S rRNA (cytosine1962-C5)-methyltransferase
VTSLPTFQLLAAQNWTDYALLDSGNGLKLEKFGPYTLIRPEPEAVWKQALPRSEWEKAVANYKPAPEENGGHWDTNKKTPRNAGKWCYNGLRFWVQPPPLATWESSLSNPASGLDGEGHPCCQKTQPKVLNLFGYSGIASLAAARAGAVVTHLDASNKVVTWANENKSLSGLHSLPIRWIVDDALKFVQREARRGSKYDGIILDPPKFGRGPKGEVWEFYKLLPTLLQACAEILSPHPLFVQLTAYAVKASAATLYYAMEEIMQGKGGATECGEIGLIEQSGKRYLSTAIYARWTNQKFLIS